MVILAAAASAAFAVAPVPVAAQAAAETAIILSGTGTAQGRAQRSLGAAITGSIGRAANAIPQRQGQRGGSVSVPTRRAVSRRGGGKFAIALPADVDPLEHTDAPVYALPNGSSIRVSGGLRRPLSASAADGAPPEGTGRGD